MELEIFLSAEGMLEGVKQEELIELKTPLKIGGLPGGMVSGKPSVSFGFTLPDGKVVFAQTSMRLFHVAAKAFAQRYGWQDAEYEVVDGSNRKGDN